MNFNYCEKEKSFIITADETEYKRLACVLENLDYSLYTIDVSFDLPLISFSVYCDGIRSEADAKVIYDYVELHSKHVDGNERTKILIEKAKKTFYHDDVEKALDALSHDFSELLRIGRAFRAFEKRAKEEAKAKAEAEAKSESEMSASEPEPNLESESKLEHRVVFYCEKCRECSCFNCRYFDTSRCPEYKPKQMNDKEDDNLPF